LPVPRYTVSHLKLNLIDISGLFVPKIMLLVGSIGAVKPSNVLLLRKRERRNVAGRSFVPAAFHLPVTPGLNTTE